eukprot:jgi/Mesen1/4663/ME000241S03703
MGSMGLLHDATSLAGVVTQALQAAGLRAIFVTGGHKPLDEAILALHLQEAQGPELVVQPASASCHNARGGDSCQLERIHVADPDAPLEANVTKARKGGGAAGTGRLPEEGVTLAGGSILCLPGPVAYEWLLPKCCAVVCPFMFDQFYWAERMAWLGVASEPLRPKVLMPPGNDPESLASSLEAVAAALAGTTSGALRRRAAQLGAEIRAEDGASEAVDILKATILKGESDHVGVF